MKILVQVACELDPDLNLRVDRRSGEVKPDLGDRLYRVWPLGRAGIAAAVALSAAEVLAFALGADHRPALLHALAAGASRAIEISPCEEEISHPSLARWLAQQQPDLVICDRLAGALAFHNEWAHLAGLADLSVAQQKLRATRHLDRGRRQLVSAGLPAAIRLHADSNPIPYISRTRLKSVHESRIEAVDLDTQAPENIETLSLQAARARTRGAKKSGGSSKASDRVKALMGLTSASTTAAPEPQAEKDPDDPQSMAQEFVRYLKHHDLISKES